MTKTTTTMKMGFDTIEINLVDINITTDFGILKTSQTQNILKSTMASTFQEPCQTKHC